MKKILFDTDPGTDDAIALHMLVHAPQLQLLGITTTFGNVPVETSTLNALYLLQQYGHADIPVASGATKPLGDRDCHFVYQIHGQDGLGNTRQGPMHATAIATPAAEWIVETVLAHPGEVTLIAIAPLTNVAQALAIEPKIASLVQEVIIMGGAVNSSGNINPAAEANIYNDPLAADAVFAADWPITLMPLDVTEQLLFTEQTLQRIAQAPHPSGAYLAKVCRFYLDYYQQQRRFAGFAGHDITAVAYAIDDSLFTYQHGAICVPTTGVAAGMTIFDRRESWPNQHVWQQRKSVKVATTIDANRLLDLYFSLIEKNGTLAP